MTLIAEHDNHTAARAQKQNVPKSDYDRYLHDQIDMHERLADVYTTKRYAPPYSRIYQRHWNKRLCDLAELQSGDRVLDFGCGTGVMLPELVRRGCRAVGLDISTAMLSSGRDKAPDAKRICGDGGRLPFAYGTFDAVLCRGSIHHLPDLPVALTEIHRVLKPGGRMAFSEPSNDSFINRFARRRMYAGSDEFHDDDEGLRRREIITMLHRTGFGVQKSRGFGFFAYTLCGFPDKLPLLQRIPANRAITTMLIAVDRILESVPLINRLALHWQLRAEKQ